MTDKPEKNKENETLKTFDMYHFFSRKDVIMMMILFVVVLGFVAFKMFFTSGVV